MKGYYTIVAVVTLFFVVVQAGMAYALHNWLDVGFWKVVLIIVVSGFVSFVINAVTNFISNK